MKGRGCDWKCYEISFQARFNGREFASLWINPIRFVQFAFSIGSFAATFSLKPYTLYRRVQFGGFLEIVFLFFSFSFGSYPRAIKVKLKSDKGAGMIGEKNDSGQDVL